MPSPMGMTIKEVAARLELHVQTIKRYIADGTIRATKIGNKWRITEAAIQDYLDSRSNIEKIPAWGFPPRRKAHRLTHRSQREEACAGIV